MPRTPPTQTPASFEEFGPLLRYLRRRARLTQREVAIAVGYSESQISRFEQGHRPPEAAALQALFLPALALEAESAWALRLLSLAATAREANSDEPARPGRALSTDELLAGLLATKLFRPRPPADLVSRPRLLDLGARALATPLTLVAAPAGSGKTTLLSSWLEQPGRTGGAGRSLRSAWLALDEHDDDPLTFLRYLVAAMQTLAPGIGGGTLRLIRSPLPPWPVLLAPLINDLAALAEECVVILDDYHLLTAPESHQAVAFLLEHLPPHLHLVIASREDPPLPLARLRARRQLYEIPASDLRFTGVEVTQLLREVMGIPVTPEQAAAVEAHTEGWAAGLQLAGLALKGRPDPAQLIAGLAGGNRYLIDYLALEVLDGLPHHLRTFLLQTSLLDRMCGPLCDAVLGLGAPERDGQPAGAYSQLLLQELERRHLFVVPLDAERRWYRYHHLFGAFLRARLRDGAAPGQLAALHRRASGWLAAHGLEAEAIEHALAGQDLKRAAQLIGEVGLRLSGQGRLHTVLGWLRALPEALVRAHPALGLLHAVLLLNTNQLAAAAGRLELVEQGLAAAPGLEERQALYGQLLVVRSSLARAAGEIGGCVADAELALQHLAGAPPMVRSAALLNAACVFLTSGDVSDASELRLREAVRANVDAGNPTAHQGGLVALGLLHTLQGRRRAAVDAYRQALGILAELGPAASGGAGAHLAYGEWLREQNLLPEAERQLALGLGLAEETAVDAHALVLGAVALAQLHLASGHLAEALDALARCDTLLRGRPVAPSLGGRLGAARALVALAAGDHAAATSWAAPLANAPIGEPSLPREQEYLALARVWLAEYQASHDPAHCERALSLLSRLLADAEAKRRLDSALRIRVLQALALQAAGAADRALATLSVALTVAAPEGYTRLFLDEGPPMAALLQTALAHGAAPDYIARLLTVFPQALLNSSAVRSKNTAPPDKDTSPECNTPAMYLRKKC